MPFCPKLRTASMINSAKASGEVSSRDQESRSTLSGGERELAPLI